MLKITKDKRYQFEVLYNTGHCKKYIMKVLGISQATYYRELQKGAFSRLNSDYTYKQEYSAVRAQKNADFQQTAKGAPLKIHNDFSFAEFVNELLKDGHYSVTAIWWLCQKQNFNTKISLSTLYNYVKQGLFLHKYKPIYKARRLKTKQEYNHNTLHPERSVEFRGETTDRRFGDWEIDSVIGKRNSSDSLLVLTERKTRYELIFQSTKDSMATVKIVTNLIQKYPYLFCSFTSDNGGEFSYNYLNYLNWYWCHPYSSWERGSNENQNRMIRRFIPKSTPLKNIKTKQIQYIQKFINNYPRGIFNGKSSLDMFKVEFEKLYKPTKLKEFLNIT